MTTEKLVAGPLRGVAEAMERLNVFTHSLEHDGSLSHSQSGRCRRCQLDKIVADVRRIAADWSNCPTKWEDIQTARAPQAGQRAEGAEAGKPGAVVADEILMRIAKRYENSSVNIYPDMPYLTPVEGVLRCAQEEGFILTSIVPAAPPVAEKTELDQAGRGECNCAADRPIKESHARVCPMYRAAALGSGQELRERIERVISAGDDLRYDEYGVMEMPIGHLATKWDIAKAELDAALALPLAPKVPDEIAALRKALTYLANEAGGMLGLSGVREAIGNTNMACLQLRVDEARELLAERDGGK